MVLCSLNAHYVLPFVPFCTVSMLNNINLIGTRGFLTPEATEHLADAGCQTLRWQAAKDVDVKYMNDQWLLHARRKLTDAQEATVNSVWAATKSPLCVRLTVHDALRWSSFEDPLAALSSQVSLMLQIKIFQSKSTVLRWKMMILLLKVDDLCSLLR